MPSRTFAALAATGALLAGCSSASHEVATHPVRPDRAASTTTRPGSTELAKNAKELSRQPEHVESLVRQKVDELEETLQNGGTIDVTSALGVCAIFASDAAKEMPVSIPRGKHLYSLVPNPAFVQVDVPESNAVIAFTTGYDIKAKRLVWGQEFIQNSANKGATDDAFPVNDDKDPSASMLRGKVLSTKVQLRLDPDQGLLDTDNEPVGDTSAYSPATAITDISSDSGAQALCDIGLNTGIKQGTPS